jgi:hypothetical protein
MFNNNLKRRNRSESNITYKFFIFVFVLLNLVLLLFPDVYFNSFLDKINSVLIKEVDFEIIFLRDFVLDKFIYIKQNLYEFIFFRKYGSDSLNTFSMLAYFTNNSEYNITEIYLSYFNNSDKIHCAFYDINSDQLLDVLNRKKALIVIDDDNIDVLKGFDFLNNNFRSDYSNKLMHNKFCILDDKIVITGSLNPTNRGINFNNNNVLVINSHFIALQYENEFKEMYFENNYHKGSKSMFNDFIFGDSLIKLRFCPEDDCKNSVINELKKAKKSIYFMTFSFTDDDIGDVILEKSNRGLEVRGIFEKTQAGSKYSEYYKLINISKLDSNKYNMHHKVFIIDNQVVITGSYNPTSNGDKNNDENIIIVNDDVIAKSYLDEFEMLY